MSGDVAERVLLIGVSGMDWAGFRAAAGAGLVPNLATLVQRGNAGPLSGGADEDSIAAWVTLATGASADRHGVVRDQEPAPAGLRPVSGASWAVAPLWERLEAAGIATAGVAWPGARPGDRWRGAHVDDSYAAASGRRWEDCALPLHCAASGWREALRDLRVHPGDIGAAQLLPLVPRLADSDQDREPGLALLAVAMAQAASVQAAAAWLLAEGGARAMFVHHHWLGDVRRRLQPGAGAPWDQLESGAWCFVDGLVGRLAALAGAGARVIVVSPGPHGAPNMIVVAGPGPAVDLGTVQLVDVTPMVAAACGVVDPPEAPLPAPEPPGPDLSRLVAQGYAAPPGPPLRWQVEGLVAQAQRCLMDDPVAAAAAAAAALALAPDDIDALSQRAAAHIALGEAAALAPLAEALQRLAPARPWGSLVHGARHALAGDAAAARPWLRAAAAGEPETTLRAGAAWLLLDRPGDAARAFTEVLEVEPGKPAALLGLSVAALARADLYGAEQAVRRLLAGDPAHGAAWQQLATILQRGGRTREAATARRTADRLGAADGTPYRPGA